LTAAASRDARKGRAAPSGAAAAVIATANLSQGVGLGNDALSKPKRESERAGGSFFVDLPPLTATF